MTASPGPESGPISVHLEVSSHESLQRVLTLLSESPITVHIEAITSPEFSEETTVEFDLGSLTDKQRQTLRLALRTGYYERPRKTDLTELATELGISKSAVSQRLRTAEHKLIKQALGHLG
ncbi:helix-turn-helix domain-containing protein [Halovenus marina]|uniref:helix-turn-helix domain-containing protein n=1 Tax=Halovenus marina TaxID=3396621 RepID=UPI003F5713C2